MRKVGLFLGALTLLVCASSCKKENVTPEGDGFKVPVYTEGVYHPTMKIATVSEGGVVTQEWNWVGDNLDKIQEVAGGATTYNYSGNYISKVSITGDQTEELRYYYDENNKFSKCEIYYDGAPAVTMNFAHNAAGKLGSANVIIEDNFLLTLASGLLGGGSLFEKVVGRPVAESMIMMARMQHAKNPKFSVGNKEFGVTFEWNGENLSKQILNGNASVVLDTNDLAMIQQFVDIPEDYLSMIQLAMAFGGGLPITLTFNDTISSTFDNNYNPMFCNWGTLISPETMSLNNVLTMSTKGAVSVSASLLGQTMNLYNTPIEDYAEYQYQCNDKKYPIQVTGSKDVVYTYKQ